MSNIRKILAGLALGLPLVACGTDGTETESPRGTGDTTLELAHRYGFVSLVDGTMGAVDLQTMSTADRVRESSRASHMLHVMEGTDQREVLYGDWDSNEAVTVRFNEDHTEHEVIERVKVPVQMHGFMGVPPQDEKFIVLPRLELQPGAMFEPDQDDDSLAMFNRTTQEWKLLDMQSPSYATWGLDGRLYVSESHHKSISVVDVEKWEVVQNVAVGEDTWVTKDFSIGPKTTNFSSDGRWLASADYEGLSVSVFQADLDADEPLTKRRVIPMPGAPKSVAFTRDGSEMWIVVFDLKGMTREEAYAQAGQLDSMGTWYDGPAPSNEVYNSYRRTGVHVWDTSSADPDDWTEIIEFHTPRGLAQPTVSPEDPSVVYLTTSAGSVYKVDRYSFRILGEAIVGRVGVPIVCGALAL